MSNSGNVSGDILLRITTTYTFGEAKWIIENLEIKWTYTLPTYTVSLEQTLGGTVSGGGTLNVGETTTITAVADEGYVFSGWSDGNQNNPRSITLTSSSITSNYTNLSYSANFKKKIYTATFKNYDGTVLQTVTVEHDSTPSYTGSTPARLSTAQYRYTFDSWSPTVGAITSDTTYTAQFTETVRSYIITTSATDGTVTGGGTYEYGTSVTLIATPNSGYKFLKWSDSVTSATRTVTVTSDAVYTAIFEVSMYELAVSLNEGAYGNITLYKNGEPQTSNLIECQLGDIFSLKVEANSGFIITSILSSEGGVEITADEFYDSGFINKSHTVLTYPELTVTETMLDKSVTYVVTLTAGSVVYTLNTSANNDNLGQLELYANGVLSDSNTVELYAGETYQVIFRANSDSFIYSLADPDIATKEEMVESGLLDDLYKTFTSPVCTVKDNKIGDVDNVVVNFTPGINIWFNDKKAIEIYYENDLADSAYFESIKL